MGRRRSAGRSRSARSSCRSSRPTPTRAAKAISAANGISAVNRMLDMAEDQAFLLPVLIDDTPRRRPACRTDSANGSGRGCRAGEAPADFTERVNRLLSGGPAAAGRAATRPARDGLTAANRRARRGFWVAVLPFKYTRRQRRPRGAGRGAVRRDRDRPVALLVPPGDRAQLDAAVRRRGASTCGPSGKELGARYVMEGSLRQAGHATPPRGAARRRDYRRPPVGGDLRSPLQSRGRSSSCRTNSSRGSSRRLPTCTGFCPGA